MTIDTKTAVTAASTRLLKINRAAVAEAGTLASRGGPESRRERVLFAIAKQLAETSGDEEGLGLYEITFGISQYLRGRWRSCGSWPFRNQGTCA